MSYAIKVSNLKKSYGANLVIKGIDLEIFSGEVFALLGVNGAGKTTTLECIEGLRKYDSGSISVNGKLGIQLQSSSLPSHIKTIEAIKLFSKWNKTKIDSSLLEALNIKDIEKKQYNQMSVGQKRRLHLALALISNPDIIFLDEPTAGLDVEGRFALHQEIRKLKNQGKIKYIGFSFHDEYEVFEEIINYYDWDFCQIQFNYMDTDTQAGLKGYELTCKKNIPLVIMEPIKGGLLAKLPGDISNILEKYREKKIKDDAKNAEDVEVISTEESKN